MITNDSEFPYQISIHAANMLLHGLIRYAEETEMLFDRGLEDGSFSLLRNGTNIREAKRLREFLLTVPEPRFAKGMLADLDALLEDLSDTDQVYREHEERFPGKTKKREVSLDSR